MTARKLNSDSVLACLAELFVEHDPPDHIRSDNGSEFTPQAVRDWLAKIGVKTLFIDPETWDRVQAMLAANACEHRTGVRAYEPSPLAGKLFDEAGRPLTPSHAVKSDRRYRYYVSRHLISGEAGTDDGDHAAGWRLPAREIERVVAEIATGLLADHGAFATAARESGIPADRVPRLLEAAKRWNGGSLDLVARADLGVDRIAVTLDLAPMIGDSGVLIRRSVSTRIRRRGVEMRLVLDGSGAGGGTPQVDPALIKAVARGRAWFSDLASGRATTLSEIAEREGVTRRYVGHLLPLAFLDPDIVEAILSGTQPVDLTAQTLIKRTDVPLSWADQKALLGFV